MSILKLCTKHYILGYCLCPPGLCYPNESCGCGGLSLCKNALQAIGEYIPQKVKNLHVFIYVFATLYGTTSCSAVCFFV